MKGFVTGLPEVYVWRTRGIFQRVLRLAALHFVDSALQYLRLFTPALILLFLETLQPFILLTACLVHC